MNQNLFWCIIGILGGAVLSFIISHHFYVKGLKKRILTYDISTRKVIDNFYIEKIDSIKITYDSNIIDKLFFSRIWVKNMGNTMIEKQDFVPSHQLSISTSGIFIRFPKDYELSSFVNTENDIHLNFNEENNCITFDFDYLSKTFLMYLNILHTDNINFDGILKDGKIISSTEINKIQIRKQKLRSFFIYVILISIVAIICIFICIWILNDYNFLQTIKLLTD